VGEHYDQRYHALTVPMGAESSEVNAPRGLTRAYTCCQRNDRLKQLEPTYQPERHAGTLYMNATKRRLIG
jgi:hypothetical protein